MSADPERGLNPSRVQRVEPTGFLSSRLRLVGANGTLSALDTGLLGRSTFRWEDRAYTIKSERLFSRTFILLDGGNRIAAAEPDGFFSSAFRLYLPSGRYVLKPRFSLEGRWDCLLDGSVAGSIRGRGIFKRGFAIDLPPNWSLPEQTFAIAVVLIAQQSDAGD